jgi:hypothetical protein
MDWPIRLDCQQVVKSVRVHSGPTNIPRNERICKNCTNQEIEDETHFLTRCPKFSGERDDLFNSISAKGL